MNEQESIKIESPERARLRELEMEGKFLFHGSGYKIDRLKPRQAHNYPTNSKEEKIPDDKPAVFATPYADTAIFMAVINKPNAPKGSRSGFSHNSNGKHEYRATQGTIEQIHNAKGYVYVFNKEKFKMRSPAEGLSYKAVEPVEVVEVSEADLPDITIKDF
ncbi:MAG: hypothetical protein A2741_01905 [Candidatus Zambryskibacteria bacterium RIFCSPHIGHO2_01_FULL_43_27]|uniref:Uncharacterized protein n=1 Tax=Candidatus Zambryskibacteria bacterium RIFCSPLOWO2_01_FULL_43_17 TaxID=1802760 RepID=A0A1G2U101_9BACT|nr:MAG: hypothetical protein A2741_01905 [Candidatus Zambryskibacteria bacterium RIFCSPHIGHO2_01_FULL_43_27]OHA99800.1 MAG: hypothetical protein A3E93_01030 [Candidatus Zambryskibacteria bacterium RIFCSPHIGHO2_12_FULL_43_12b]OHB03195.1 MAG: hypothetical protein A2920_02390 [Candidatus Zambryskibacteria bacterium RIFCSPLOWO2_01_FULL_43_17]